MKENPHTYINVGVVIIRRRVSSDISILNIGNNCSFRNQDCALVAK